MNDSTVRPFMYTQVLRKWRFIASGSTLRSSPFHIVCVGLRILCCPAASLKFSPLLCSVYCGRRGSLFQFPISVFSSNFLFQFAVNTIKRSYCRICSDEFMIFLSLKTNYLHDKLSNVYADLRRLCCLVSQLICSVYCCGRGSRFQFSFLIFILLMTSSQFHFADDKICKQIV